MKTATLLGTALFLLAAACGDSSDGGSTGDDANVTAGPKQALQGAERKAFLDAVRKDFFKITGRSTPAVEFIVDEMTDVTPPATERGDLRVSLVARPVQPGTTTPYDFHGTPVQKWIDNGQLGIAKLQGAWDRDSGQWSQSGQVLLGSILFFDGGSLVPGGRSVGELGDRNGDGDGDGDGDVSPLEGQFERQHKEDGIAAGFTIKSATDTEVVFDLTAVLTSPGAHNGEIQGGKAKLENNLAVYTEGSDCKITFAFDDAHRSAAVKQDGSCGDAGFGAFVDVTGQYKKK